MSRCQTGTGRSLIDCEHENSEHENMTTKFDLSFVSYDEIFAELQRRYPAGVISFVHHVEGQPEGQTLRFDTWGKSIVEILGIAEMTHLGFQRHAMSTMGRPTAPGLPLDGGPNQPPAAT